MPAKTADHCPSLCDERQCSNGPLIQDASGRDHDCVQLSSVWIQRCQEAIARVCTRVDHLDANGVEMLNTQDLNKYAGSVRAELVIMSNSEEEGVATAAYATLNCHDSIINLKTKEVQLPERREPAAHASEPLCFKGITCVR
jgi:hypothetical protein